MLSSQFYDDWEDQPTECKEKLRGVSQKSILGLILHDSIPRDPKKRSIYKICRWSGHFGDKQNQRIEANIATANIEQ